MNTMTITYELAAGQPMYIGQDENGKLDFDTLASNEYTCRHRIRDRYRVPTGEGPTGYDYSKANALPICRVYCGITTDHRAL